MSPARTSGGEVLTLILSGAASAEVRAATATALARVAAAGGKAAVGSALGAAWQVPVCGSLVIDVRNGRCLTVELDRLLPERVVYFSPHALTCPSRVDGPEEEWGADPVVRAAAV